VKKTPRGGIKSGNTSLPRGSMLKSRQPINGTGEQQRSNEGTICARKRARLLFFPAFWLKRKDLRGRISRRTCRGGEGLAGRTSCKKTTSLQKITGRDLEVTKRTLQMIRRRRKLGGGERA